MLVSYDPGVKAAGVAIWQSDGELYRAFLVRDDDWIRTAHRAATRVCDICYVDEIAVEIPQVYVQSRLKGDPNDLITLALNAGAFCASFLNTPRFEYRPYEWKKQVPKAILTERTRTKLSIGELACVEKAPRTLMHNVFDAVGIGLHHLKRK